MCLPHCECSMTFSRWSGQQSAWTSLSSKISSPESVNHCYWCYKLLISQGSIQQSPRDDDHFVFSSRNRRIFILLTGLQDYAWDFDYIIIDSWYPGLSYNLHVIHLTKRHKIFYQFLVSFVIQDLSNSGKLTLRFHLEPFNSIWKTSVLQTTTVSIYDIFILVGANKPTCIFLVYQIVEARKP